MGDTPKQLGGKEMKNKMIKAKAIIKESKDYNKNVSLKVRDRKKVDDLIKDLYKLSEGGGYDSNIFLKWAVFWGHNWRVEVVWPQKEEIKKMKGRKK